MMPYNECDGNCICVYCQIRVIHEQKTPCCEHNCRQCGRPLIREGSYHHQLYLEKLKAADNARNSK